jgi:hypothetical protein
MNMKIEISLVRTQRKIQHPTKSMLEGLLQKVLKKFLSWRRKCGWIRMSFVGREPELERGLKIKIRKLEEYE